MSSKCLFGQSVNSVVTPTVQCEKYTEWQQQRSPAVEQRVLLSAGHNRQAQETLRERTPSKDRRGR